MYLRYVTYTLACMIIRWVGNCFKAAEHRSERARDINRYSRGNIISKEDYDNIKETGTFLIISDSIIPALLDLRNLIKNEINITFTKAS